MSERQSVLVDDLKADIPNAIVGGPFGSNLVSRDYVNEGIPVIRGSNMGQGRWVSGPFAHVSEEKAEELSGNTARPGDLVFTQRGTLGQVCLVPEGSRDRYIISQSQMKLTMNPSMADNLFLYYVFTSSPQQHYIQQNAIQTGVPHTNLAFLRGTPLELPDLPEQRCIAHVLGTLDDKIELNRRMNRTLEAVARAIFKSWFVDFDPVHAKAEGLEPVGMDRETATLFPDSFQDSPLGKIPKQWEVKPFSEIVEINPSRRLKKDSLAPYVDMASLPTSGSQLQASPATREYKSGSRFRNGDVLFARITPCLENGKTVLVDFLERGVVGAGSTEFLVFGPDLAGTHFAYCASRWNVLRENAIASMTGTSGRQRAQKGAFDHFEMAVPDFGLLNTFEKCVANLFLAQRRASLETASLAATRDTLLPKLLSGDITSSEGETNG